MAVFEPSHPPAPFWCQSHSPFHYSPPHSPFYDVPLFFMAGPTRTDSSNHRANPLSTNPPRPPNAWILYRSDKLKHLPPPPPGMPRRPQADISKTISSMWKSESPDVRAHYERLSDIRKAEHQALYPGYRFQPMKKADKDRLRAEKQAERERERGARKSKARARATPLYTTTDARPDAAAGPSTHTHPTPPPEHPTPRPSPPPQPSSPALYPAPPATPAIAPPLAAPQPGVPQRPPSASDWRPEQLHDFDPLWLDQAEFSQQEYLTVPLPSTAPQYPLGWTPDDPAPSTDIPFFPAAQPQPPQDPLHAVLSATDDPNVFDLGDFDVNELFDGSRPLEVSMGANMLPSAFVDMNQYSAFASSLFFDFDAAAAENGNGNAHGNGSTDPALDGLASYSFESAFADVNSNSNSYNRPAFEDLDFPPAPQRSPTPTPEPAHAQTPYAPPAGAANSSTRRVAADWRHIRPSER